MDSPLSEIEIIKKSGERAVFSMERLKNSLRKSQADEELVQEIARKVYKELYPGISTREIYNRAFSLLKKREGALASRYKLKKAIYELGPTGFPFEKLISALLFYSGYKTETNQILQGKCVTHEVDVLAQKKDEYIVVECKFHSDESRKCDVKIPLYIYSRYSDIYNFCEENPEQPTLSRGWVVTNTRFSVDAMDYGQCVGLFLLAWDYPKNDGLKDRIDRLGLYPVTVSTLLSRREKQFLLSRDVVLCKQLVNDKFYLDHLGISEKRQERILKEILLLCDSKHHDKN